MTFEVGHSPGTRPPERCGAAKESARPPVQTTVVPRLLSVEAAAQYLSVSSWSIRDYIASGRLPAVHLPAPRGQGRTIRRVLIDRADLDALVDAWKERAP